MAFQIHSQDYCGGNFSILAETLTNMYNTGQKKEAYHVLNNCYQGRVAISRGFGGANRGHQEAADVVKNLMTFLFSNPVEPPIQIVYSEPKTFTIYTQSFGLIGSIGPYGFTDPMGVQYPMQGGKKKKTRTTRKYKKSRKVKKTRAHK